MKYTDYSALFIFLAVVSALKNKIHINFSKKINIKIAATVIFIILYYKSNIVKNIYSGIKRDIIYGDGYIGSSMKLVKKESDELNNGYGQKFVQSIKNLKPKKEDIPDFQLNNKYLIERLKSENVEAIIPTYNDKYYSLKTINKKYVLESKIDRFDMKTTIVKIDTNDQQYSDLYNNLNIPNAQILNSKNLDLNNILVTPNI